MSISLKKIAIRPNTLTRVRCLTEILTTFVHVTFSRGREMGVSWDQEINEGQNETCKTGEHLWTLFSV